MRHLRASFKMHIDTDTVEIQEILSFIDILEVFNTQRNERLVSAQSGLHQS